MTYELIKFLSISICFWEDIEYSLSKNLLFFHISPMKKASWWIKVLAIVNVVGFIAVLVVNYLANALPIGGLSTGALSDLYPNLFVPAGLTFDAWRICCVATYWCI